MYLYRRRAHQYRVQGMGAQYHPRQIRKTWLSAFRTDGRLKPVTSANRQIIIATTRVQKVGSRKRLEQREDISFFFNPPRWPTAITLCVPSGFLSADDTAPDQPYFFIYHRLSSAHRSFVVLTTTAKTLSVCHVCRQMREREREIEKRK